MSYSQCAACFKIHQDDVGGDFIAMIFGFCADCCEKESIQIGVGRNAADLHKLLKDSPWQVLGMTDVEKGPVFTLKRVDGDTCPPRLQAQRKERPPMSDPNTRDIETTVSEELYKEIKLAHDTGALGLTPAETIRILVREGLDNLYERRVVKRRWRIAPPLPSQP